MTPAYPPYKAGMAHVANEEAVRLASRGHDVHVVTRMENSLKAEEVLDGVRVHRWSSLVPYGKAGWIPFLYSRVSKLNPDIVHLHLPFFGVQELTLWGKNVNLVATYHMDITAGGFVGFVSSVSRRLFLPRLFNRLDRIFVASMDYAKTCWLSDHWSGLSDKIIETPFGVDLDRFKPGGKKAAGDKCKLLFVGALDRAHPFKGVEKMFAALAEIRERNDWYLTVVGGGDMLPGYKEAIKEKGLDSRVAFTGRVSDSDLPKYYRDSDLFLFPSTSRAEAFGLVALEAQASGVPVLASNLDGVRTVVEDNVTGWLVPIGDIDALRRQIEWCLDNRSALSGAGERARDMVEERFTWKRHIDNLERVYNEVASS